jgi:anti-sigma factor ChrR (cupin superfamily)
VTTTAPELTNPLAWLVDTEAMAWDGEGTGNAMKVLWVSEETGAWIALIKAAAGQVNPPHVHLGPADFFVLSGRLEYRGGAAGPGAYVREPAGAVHDATTTPVETVYLANVQGPIAFFGPDGTISHVSTGEQIRKRWQAQQANAAQQVATA